MGPAVPATRRKREKPKGEGTTSVDQLTEEERTAKALEEKLERLMKQKGITYAVRNPTGRPGETICKIAEDECADMIVTGTRGQGKVKRALKGSVSDYLVHHAHCPVIVCRHSESGRGPPPSGGLLRNDSEN